MKKFVLFFAAVALASLAHAQIIREGVCEFNKVDRSAIIAEIDQPSDVVEYGLLEDMKERKYGKGDNEKGFIAFTGIKFPQISTETIDIYFKIEAKKKDEGKTILYMLISRGNDNFMSSTKDPAVFTAAREYIKNLAPIFQNRSLDLQISAQEKLIKDTEKTVDDLESKIKSLEKKIEESKKELEKAQKDLGTKKDELSTQKASLSNMKSSKH